MPEEKQSSLIGLRTYLMGSGIIIHQILKQGFGIDVEDGLISSTIDAVLGFGAIYFRWRAAVAQTATKKEGA
mgnify:CR=1 FL=1